MTDKTDLIREIHEYVTTHGGENTATHLLVQAASAIQTQAAELEAVGAGGVSGPLMGQPQAMPDWVQYEETSDVLIVHGKRYAAGIFGKAGFLGPPGTLLRVECGDADCVTLARVPPSANAGEPRALNPRHIRKFLQALQAGEMSVSRAVEILDAWVGGYYEDEMVPLPPPDSCLIADDEFPMEIVRKLRSELAAAPPTAQAEVENLRKALQFYADKQHFAIAEEGAWDTVSGEPQNYWCDEAGTAMVEDGSIAKMALAGQLINFADDEDETAPPTSAEGVEHG